MKIEPDGLSKKLDETNQTVHSYSSVAPGGTYFLYIYIKVIYIFFIIIIIIMIFNYIIIFCITPIKKLFVCFRLK